jgi:hypothetical protein
VEEAAALASLVLFLGMIAIWAQVIATRPVRGDSHSQLIVCSSFDAASNMLL